MKNAPKKIWKTYPSKKASTSFCKTCGYGGAGANRMDRYVEQSGVTLRGQILKKVWKAKNYLKANFGPKYTRNFDKLDEHPFWKKVQ